jgi:hypothetical protein
MNGCTGPCNQGKTACPTPEACQRPEADGLELLGSLAVALAAVVVIGLLVGLA